MDGTELTLRRTGAASALASSYLSRTDSRRLLIVGTGALAPHLARSHCRVRPIDSIRIWGRSSDRARSLAQELAGSAHRVEATDDLRSAVQWADIISCATLATAPLILGEWLVPGQHLDLVGSFKAGMREADTHALQRAKIFVDMRANAMADAGEIIQALESGALRPADILADLPDLTRGTHGGRSSHHDITLFKSVGHALEDLAAAQLVMAQEPGMIRA
jgi:ornithine cyclodeaminase